MLPLQILSKIIKILRSGQTPAQIAGGFILGMILGLLPSVLNPIGLLVILVLIILNVNMATAFLSFAIFSLIAFFLDPLFHSIGFALLVDASFLQGLWTTLYNIPFVPLTGFNNTVVLGSLVSALILLYPVYWLVKKFVIYYREKYEPKFQKMKWVKLVKGSAVYNWYQKLKFLGD